MTVATLDHRWAVDQRRALRLGYGLAVHDIRQRYRGSAIGPFWISANLAVTAVAVGFVYSAVFGVPYREYLAYFATGLVIWNYFAPLLTESTVAFVNATGIIRNVRLPMSSYIYRNFFRHLVVGAHNMVVLAIVYAATQVVHLEGVLPAMAGLVLVTAICVPASVVLGLVGTRYRDVTQIIANLLQFMMFLTPIFWFAKDASSRGVIIQLNPFFHMVEVFRRPLIEGEVPLLSFAVCGGLATASIVTALVAYRIFSNRVAFWL